MQAHPADFNGVVHDMYPSDAYSLSVEASQRVCFLTLIKGGEKHRRLEQSALSGDFGDLAFSLRRQAQTLRRRRVQTNGLDSIRMVDRVIATVLESPFDVVKAARVNGVACRVG